jgi:hypothetical protein
MAFTEENRCNARVFCGRPLQPARDIYGASDVGDVDVALDALEGNATREALVVAQIDACKAVETEIAGMHGFVPMQQAEEVKVDPAASGKLRENLRRECSKLATMLGVKIVDDVASGGWRQGSMLMG